MSWRLHSRPQRGHRRLPSPGGTWARRNRCWSWGLHHPLQVLRGGRARGRGSSAGSGPDRTRRKCCDLKAASAWGALFTPLPHSQGPAVARPCPCPRVLNPPGARLSCRGPGRWAPAATFFAWVRLCFYNVAFHPNTRGCFSPVRVPEDSESRGLRADRPLHMGHAHVHRQSREPRKHPPRLSQQGRPEESGRLPSSVHTGARPPSSSPSQTPGPTACVGDTEQGWRRGGAVSGSEAGAPAHEGLSAVFPGEGPPGQRLRVREAPG